MKKILPILISLILSFLILPDITYAIDDPLVAPNNKMGIHILFDHEVEEGAKLVNSNGGSWGYVVVPIQAGDKNIDKWQKFMDEAKKNRVIPVMRLSTEGDYFNNKVWRKPHENDIVDFANFLNSLEWPTKNRYVIVFNETNRGDEWGGSANPAEYANILSFAVTVFKSKSQDFFIISGGLDNAAPSQGTEYMNQYDYMRQMNMTVPGIFNQIDGLASHSYPNPAFAQPPNTTSLMGTGSFIYERELARNLSGKTLPVFITETGWSTDAVSQNLINSYYQSALTTVWTDPGIVMIAPFLLQGTSGPFQKFTFLDAGGNPTGPYTLWHDFPKVKGRPSSPGKVLALNDKEQKPEIKETPRISFDENRSDEEKPSARSVGSIFKWLLRL